MPRIYTKTSLEDRFLDKVRKTSSCWLWTGAKNNKGYGQIFITRSPSRIVRLAHRVSWELRFGTIPDGVAVLHKCDTPLCVNPSHLFLGSQQQNIADCVSKGRNAKGVRNAHAKLTEKDVQEIRAAAKGIRGESKVIARLYGVSDHMVRLIIKRKNWKHV